MKVERLQLAERGSRNRYQVRPLSIRNRTFTEACRILFARHRAVALIEPLLSDILACGHSNAIDFADGGLDNSDLTPYGPCGGEPATRSC